MRFKHGDNRHKHKVAVLVDDLFFLSRIREAANKAGVELVALDDPENAIGKLVETIPDGILLDLEPRAWNVLGFLQKLSRVEELSRLPKVGFYSHVRSDLALAAKKAGCQTVLPRSALSKFFSDFALFRFGVDSDPDRS